MARRKNNLSERELTIVRKSTRSYVESFQEALKYFLEDCDLRNLRPFTIRYYNNEIQVFLNQLEEQEFETRTLKPYNFTEEQIQEHVIRYMRKGLKGCFYQYTFKGITCVF